VRQFRTLLEQKIRERRETFEEFAAYAETFAREHREPGTLSIRHLQRLAAGRRSDGRPLGPVQPATARLLERIFGHDIDELLSPPQSSASGDDAADELRQLLYVSNRVDNMTIGVLREQLAGIRRLDRQLGAIVAHEEVLTKARQVESLLSHSLTGETREHLAALLSEFHCLAGWQALDMGNVAASWRHYDSAKTAALHSGIPPFTALAAAGQAFVLADIGETSAAVQLLSAARRASDRKCSLLLRAWLAAAHGETLAANGQHADSLRAFDRASVLLPTDAVDHDGPYVALDPIHLARWRGHALARCGDAEAVDVLANALDGLDSTFTRAETGLRVDLATALTTLGECAEAQTHAERAGQLARQIGSVRQQLRIQAINLSIG
jgi:tetratricopeptide (TPR) repeat protein